MLCAPLDFYLDGQADKLEGRASRLFDILQSAMRIGLNLNILTRKHRIKFESTKGFLFLSFVLGFLNCRVERRRLCVGGNSLNI